MRVRQEYEDLLLIDRVASRSNERDKEIEKELAKQDLREAKDGESGWYVKVKTSDGVVTVWATDDD
jgi:hypothetical protein